MNVTLSDHQTNLCHRLIAEPHRYICRHGYSFRLCNAIGEYVCCVSSPTKTRLQMCGLIRHQQVCPNARRPEQVDSWIPQPDAIREALGARR